MIAIYADIAASVHNHEIGTVALKTKYPINKPPAKQLKASSAPPLHMVGTRVVHESHKNGTSMVHGTFTQQPTKAPLCEKLVRKDRRQILARYFQLMNRKC